MNQRDGNDDEKSSRLKGNTFTLADFYYSGELSGGCVAACPKVNLFQTDGELIQIYQHSYTSKATK